MFKLSPRLAVVAILALLGPVAAASGQEKLDRSLREGKKSGQSQHVILKARPGYEGWVRDLLAKNGATIDAELPSINAIAAELGPAALKALCEDSNVSVGCSSDPVVSPSALPVTRGPVATAPLATYNPSSLNTLLV